MGVTPNTAHRTGTIWRLRVTLEGGSQFDVLGTAARLKSQYERIYVCASDMDWLEFEGHTDTPDRAPATFRVRASAIMAASLVLAY